MRKNFIKGILSLFLTLAVFIPNDSFAATDMSRTEVGDIIRQNSNLNEQQINRLLDELSVQFGVEPGQKIPIKGVLYTSGMNSALFVDNDEWLMDATIVDPSTNELIEIPDLFSVYFYNGGLKIELAYKWMFTFVPSDTSIHQLDKGVFGRGLGVTMEAFVGLEGAWMPGNNRRGHLFHIALKVGAGGGVNFPKMEFTKRNIR